MHAVRTDAFLHLCACVPMFFPHILYLYVICTYVRTYSTYCMYMSVGCLPTYYSHNMQYKQPVFSTVHDVHRYSWSCDSPVL